MDFGGKKNPFYGKHHSLDARKKISESKRGKSSWNKGKELSEEHKRNLREAHKNRLKGELSPFWKGENCKTKQERNDSRYQNWVKQVKKRDNWKCRMNNKDCSGHCIVHHILPWRDYPELRYEVKNGITLCQHHHPRKRVDEQRLIPFFISMVEAKELI